jgi:hypothetical protein
MFRRLNSTIFVALAAILIIFSITTTVSAQVIINEVDYHNGFIEIKNVGGDTVDISGWWLCARFVYPKIFDLQVESGNTNLAPGGILAVSGFDMNAASSDLGLYSGNDFGNSDDYGVVCPVGR